MKKAGPLGAGLFLMLFRWGLASGSGLEEREWAGEREWGLKEREWGLGSGNGGWRVYKKKEAAGTQ